MLYETVTGHQPFRSETAVETIERLRAGRYEPLPSSAPERLRQAIPRGLDPDPTRRPADARAFGAMIAAPPVEPVPGTGPGDHDLTERLDVTEHLAPPIAEPTRGTTASRSTTVPAPSTPDPMPAPAPPIPASGPALRERVDDLLERPAVADAMSRAKQPQTIFVAIGVLLLLLLLFAATRDGGGGAADVPTSDEPAAQLDQNLDRIEELG